MLGEDCRPGCSSTRRASPPTTPRTASSSATTSRPRAGAPSRSSTCCSDLDLFETRKQPTFTPANPDGTPGQPQLIAEFFAVSEDKLKALPTEKPTELMDNGALAQIYAHLMSLVGWDRLISMARPRQNGQARGAGQSA